MTPEQEVTDDNRTFKAKLIRLADESGLGEGGFAVWLGYTIGHISKVKNGHLPVDRTLDLLLETLEENHRLKQEVARVRGAAAELMGAAMPHARHTAASYWHALKGEVVTARNLGHSEAILHRHYRALVTPTGAKSFFALMPDAPP